MCTYVCICVCSRYFLKFSGKASKYSRTLIILSRSNTLLSEIVAGRKRFFRGKMELKVPKKDWLNALGVYLKIQNLKGRLIKKGVYLKIHKLRKEKKTFSGTCSNRTIAAKIGFVVPGKYVARSEFGKMARMLYTTNCKKWKRNTAIFNDVLRK